jgi:23S rRNA pseudouridine1911/1915/1917 synthase
MKLAFNSQSFILEPGNVYYFSVEKDFDLKRIDIFLSNVAACSRSFIQQLIDAQCVSLNEKKISKSSTLVRFGDRILIKMPTAHVSQETITLRPEIESVKLIFEHEHFLVLEKPAGLMVHPARYMSNEPSLIDWLKINKKDVFASDLSLRPGIVHRLDKDTSGLILVARTPYGFMQLSNHFKNRTIKKTYLALVFGYPFPQGSIDAFVGRDPHTKIKMTAIENNFHSQKTAQLSRFRSAQTHFEVITQFKELISLLKVMPITGRTHQIRVHLASKGFPIVGDSLYGKGSDLINRQALHAHAIAFEFDGTQYEFFSPLPDDIENMIKKLSSI